MSDQTSKTEHPEGLTRTGVHRVLASEFGANWRSWRWWSRQFTPTSLSVIGFVASAAALWIVHLSQKVDNQGTKIKVIEQQVLPYMHAQITDAALRQRVADINDRLRVVEDRLDYAKAQAGTPPGHARAQARK
jgi:hypothetical protein